MIQRMPWGIVLTVAIVALLCGAFYIFGFSGDILGERAEAFTLKTSAKASLASAHTPGYAFYRDGGDGGDGGGGDGGDGGGGDGGDGGGGDGGDGAGGDGAGGDGAGGDGAGGDGAGDGDGGGGCCGDGGGTGDGCCGGDTGGGDGCCGGDGGGDGGYSQASYYSQSTYYSQSQYYSEASYYSQSQYYSEASYYHQGNYYSEGSYYSQGYYNQQPTCEITATPDHIVIHEDPLLEWSSTNATSATLNQGIGSVPVNGTYNVFPEETTTYTLTVTGPGGSAQCSVTVTVTVVPPEDSETSCDIWTDDSHVEAGDTVRISWSSEGNDPWIDGHGDVNNDGFFDVQVWNDRTFTLHVYSNFGEEEECSVTVYVDDVPPPPQEDEPYCDIWASDTTIKDYESTTLTWVSANASSAGLSSIGSVPVNGSRIVSPDHTTTYTLTVHNSSGSDQCQITIVVEEDTEDAPTCDIWASDTSISQWQSTTLTWVSDNADSASLQSIGSVSTNGSRSVSPDHTTTYTLTVHGDGGSAQCQVTITVDEEDEDDSNPSCDLSASDTHISDDESTTLNWNSDDASSASLSSIGSVGLDGSRVVSPNETKTYTLTVWDEDGESEQCRVTIIVDEDDNNGDEPSCDIYQAQSNNYWWNAGNAVYLSWDSNNADRATLSSVGNVPTDGSKTVYPSRTTTYTLTVWNDQGTEQCSTTVQVNDDDDDDNKRPYCTIKLVDHFDDDGARLSWWSTDADYAEIQGVGIVNTSDSIRVPEGTNRTYTMTVYGDGGVATCHTSYVTPYLPPLIGTPYVSLTQIPYTGFDFGPIGNAMYWLGMILLALGATYITLYYVPQMRRHAFAGVTTRSINWKETLDMQYQAFSNVAEAAAAPIYALFRRS